MATNFAFEGEVSVNSVAIRRFAFRNFNCVPDAEIFSLFTFSNEFCVRVFLFPIFDSFPNEEKADEIANGTSGVLGSYKKSQFNLQK